MPKKMEETEEEEITCPVCGKPVGLEVPSCPYCGAEFEEEGEAAEEEPAEAVGEEETAECPVCGKAVSLAVSTCPSCGAEFEEEEVEEVIEVEEPAAPKHVATKVPVEEEAVEEYERAEEEAPVAGAPSSIMDLRVIGVALAILGIIGSQIAFMIDWYWSWVPPIEDNIGLFVTIPLVVIVVGLLVFMLIRNARAAGKRVPLQLPGASLSLFLFGIFALVLMLLYRPINDGLQSSQAGVGGVFVAMLVVGVLIVFLGMRSARSYQAA